MSVHETFRRLAGQLENAVLGQSQLVERMLVALLADGLLLVEGLPGLAKTRAIRMLAAMIEADFHRIQFTPDLEDYIVALTVPIRRPERWGDDLAGTVLYGASPRGAIALERCARARAWLDA